MVGTLNIISVPDGAKIFLDGIDTLLITPNTFTLNSTTITVPGLTSSITTAGRETTGSGRYGRSISTSGGKFTDTFDGLAVHIYNFNSTCPPPQCNFTITQ